MEIGLEGRHYPPCREGEGVGVVDMVQAEGYLDKWEWGSEGEQGGVLVLDVIETGEGIGGVEVQNVEEEIEVHSAFTSIDAFVNCIDSR